VHLLRCDRRDQRRAAIRCDGVDDAEQPGGGNEPREHERAAGAARRAGATAERAGDPREERREIHGLLAGRRVEGLVCRDLPHDQQRDAGLQVHPAADAECEQEPGRQSLGAARVRHEAQQRRRRRPHDEEDEQRHCRPARELVEGQCIVDRRARQRRVRLDGVQPADRSEDDGERCRRRQ
jgi:hypothetical protein